MFPLRLFPPCFGLVPGIHLQVVQMAIVPCQRVFFLLNFLFEQADRVQQWIKGILKNLVGIHGPLKVKIALVAAGVATACCCGGGSRERESSHELPT